MAQLSWMISLTYQGAYIIVLHGLLSAGLGAQFACLEGCSFFRKQPEKWGLLAAASLWTLLEWARVFLLCGFTWNPWGLAMAYSHYPLYLASFFGIYGLSFWVFLTNGFAFFFLKNRSVSSLVFWAALVFFPPFFGYLHEKVCEKELLASKSISVALVQTSLFPEEKSPSLDKDAFVYPLEQWMNVLDFLQQGPSSLDLIVFPEVAFPFGPDRLLYRLESIQDLWRFYFGGDSLRYLPKRIPSYAERGEKDVCYVSNSYVAQALANQYGAEVIVGFDHKRLGKSFNGAFYFSPHARSSQHYNKRVLVPGSEYLPFSWCRDIARRYGALGAYEHGQQPGIFSGKTPIGVSICYEETQTHFSRQTRQMGAEIFVNLSNDAWFPDTLLARQHFDHGRIRGVENGVAVLRATNTGLTAVINPFGAIEKTLPVSRKSTPFRGALFMTLPTYSYQTLYTQFGNTLIVSFSFVCLGSFFLFLVTNWIKTDRVKALAQKIVVR